MINNNSVRSLSYCKHANMRSAAHLAEPASGLLYTVAVSLFRDRSFTAIGETPTTASLHSFFCYFHTPT